MSRNVFVTKADDPEFDFSANPISLRRDEALNLITDSMELGIKLTAIRCRASDIVAIVPTEFANGIAEALNNYGEDYSIFNMSDLKNE